MTTPKVAPPSQRDLVGSIQGGATGGLAVAKSDVQAKYYLENREKIMARSKARYEKLKDEINAKQREKTASKPKIKKAPNREPREVMLAKKKAYRGANKERIQVYMKSYLSRYVKERRATDKKFNLTSQLRHRIYLAMKNLSKNGKTMACKEYGIDFNSILIHVGEKPSNGFQLDHIIPLSSFDLDNPLHVRLAHTPQNLQWLPRADNIIKGAKIPEWAFYDPVLSEILLITAQGDPVTVYPPKPKKARKKK